ncbi:MAG: serine/threonine-protein kinase, partial [Ilumatobacteraceae bacterium]
MTLVGTRFEVGSEIGRGSFSEVYVALDTHTSTPVALKVLAAGEPDAALHEVRVLQQCRHPNVIAYYDSGREQEGPFAGRVWIATALAERTLADRVDTAGGTLPWTDLRPIVIDVLRGLAYLHGPGSTVHRDVKPDNVLDLGGTWAVGDLGLSGEQAATAGATAYRAPELEDGAPATPASDLYSLGRLIAHCLTGSDDPDAPIEDPEARRFVGDLCATDPSARPRTAVDALERLQIDRAARDSTTGAKAPALEARAAPAAAVSDQPTGRMRRRVVVAAIAVTLLVVGVTISRRSSTSPVGTARTNGTDVGPRATIQGGAPVTGAQPAPAALPGAQQCTNLDLGYRIDVPADWSVTRRAGEDEWGDCQLIEPSGLNPGAPEHEYPTIMFDTIPRSALGATGTPGDAWRPAQSGDAPAWSRIYDLQDGYRVASYVVDRGRYLLALSLVSEFGEDSASFAGKTRVLDQLAATLKLLPVGCGDSHARRCGSFYWEPDPAPNGPVAVTGTPEGLIAG